MQEIRSGCILLDVESQDILIVHNTASDYWGFPKGRVNKGESQHEAAARELFEEAGVSIPAQDLKICIRNGRDTLFLVPGTFCRECTVDGREIDQYDWVPLADLKAKKTSNFTRRFIAKLERDPRYAAVCAPFREANFMSQSDAQT